MAVEALVQPVSCGSLTKPTNQSGFYQEACGVIRKSVLFLCAASTHLIDALLASRFCRGQRLRAHLHACDACNLACLFVLRVACLLVCLHGITGMPCRPELTDQINNAGVALTDAGPCLCFARSRQGRGQESIGGMACRLQDRLRLCIVTVQEVDGWMWCLCACLCACASC